MALLLQTLDHSSSSTAKEEEEEEFHTSIRDNSMDRREDSSTMIRNTVTRRTLPHCSSNSCNCSSSSKRRPAAFPQLEATVA